MPWPREEGLRRSPLLRGAVVLWTVVLLVVLGRSLLQPTRNSVYPIFARAGACWISSQPLYGKAPAERHLDEFRYSPVAAALLAPCGLLPLPLGGFLWRALNGAVLLAGFLAFARHVSPGRDALDGQAAGGLGILLLPWCIPSLNNGQTNPLVIGLLLLALASVARQRWSCAALCLAVPVLLKVYPLAPALLLMLVYPRRLAGRLTLFLAAGMLLPFVLQHPAYVAEQFHGWVEYLASDDRGGRSPVGSYRDFHLLLRLAGLSMSPASYRALQLAIAAGIAAIIVRGRERFSRPEMLGAILDLSCGWMTLLGPATESCTYTLLAPTLALTGWQAMRPGRSGWTRGLFVAIVALIIGGMTATALPGGKSFAFFASPLAALLLFGERLVRRVAVRKCVEREVVRIRWSDDPSQGMESLTMEPKSLVTIVCPAYQEEEVLPLFHAELTAALAPLERDHAFEILFVDDGSRDHTLAVLRHLALRDRRVRYLALSRNFGHQVALTAGLEHARGAAVISMDVDLQHPPAIIAELLWKWREGHDVVITVRQEDPRLGRFKRWSSQAFYRLLRRVSATEVRLAASDFRLLSRKALVALLQMREQHRFLRGMVQWLGFPTAEVHFRPDERRAGQSKYTLRRMLRLAADGLFSFSDLPLRLPLYLGVLVLVVGLGHGAWFAWQVMSGAGTALEPGYLIVAVHLLGGSLLCAVGGLGEYLRRIHEQVKDRPLYVVREISPVVSRAPALTGEAPAPMAQREAA